MSSLPLSSSCPGPCPNICVSNQNPGIQYQTQRVIQNAVRVYESLYMMNLAALNAYQAPLKNYEVVDVAGSLYTVSPGVNWNQMSDRRQPHVQVVKTASGSTYGASSTRHTVVRMRPGAMSPGGTGVDIKHNSYDRYLNRLKGRGPLRQQAVPVPTPVFNPAFPVYGNKTFKAGIIGQCLQDCPEAVKPLPEPKPINPFLFIASGLYTYDEANRQVTFQGDGTIQFGSLLLNAPITYTVVGGGGGGGVGAVGIGGGGGGGGEVLIGSFNATEAVLSVIIGQGGAAGFNVSPAANGGATSVNGAGLLLSAQGGFGGVSANVNGNGGNSGAGGQGGNGGNSAGNGVNGGGGGGGNGLVGNGGTNNISLVYGGGGGGGGSLFSTQLGLGVGGGGNGGNSITTVARDGTVNTGGGGGGKYVSDTSTKGAGGSGVVVFQW